MFLIVVHDCMFTKETVLYEIKTFSCMRMLCYSQFFVKVTGK